MFWNWPEFLKEPVLLHGAHVLFTCCGSLLKTVQMSLEPILKLLPGHSRIRGIGPEAAAGDHLAELAILIHPVGAGGKGHPRALIRHVVGVGVAEREGGRLTPARPERR